MASEEKDELPTPLPRQLSPLSSGPSFSLNRVHSLKSFEGVETDGDGVDEENEENADAAPAGRALSPQLKPSFDMSEFDKIHRRSSTGGHHLEKAHQAQQSGHHKHRARSFVFSLKFQAFMIVITLADVLSFVLVTFGPERWEPALEWVAIVALFFYALELVLKMFGCGLFIWARSLWNWFDFFILLVSAILINSPGKIVVVARLFRLLKNCRAVKSLSRFVKVGRVVTQSANRGRNSTLAVRRKVSGNKLRYVDQDLNFDLDLTYITPSMIAMGVPTVNFWISFYRNPIKDVARFFRKMHRGNFWIFNCCPELPYPSEPFDGRITCFDIKDHTPPAMDGFVEFVTKARMFLAESKDNVIAIHCKGGKGRTGSMCCAWLMYDRLARSPREALEEFAIARSNKLISGRLCGVETPSQVRYVYQLYNHFRRTHSWSSTATPPPICPTSSIVLHSLRFERGFFAKPKPDKPIKVLVQCGGNEVSKLVYESPSMSDTTVEVALENIEVSNDVRISVFQHDAKNTSFCAHQEMRKVPNAMKAKGLVAHFMFHTSFMTVTEDEREQVPDTQSDRDLVAAESSDRVFEVDVSALDKAHKRVRKGTHAEGSAIQLVYTPIVDEAAASSVQVDPAPSAEVANSAPAEADHGHVQVEMATITAEYATESYTCSGSLFDNEDSDGERAPINGGCGVFSGVCDP